MSSSLDHEAVQGLLRLLTGIERRTNKGSSQTNGGVGVWVDGDRGIGKRTVGGISGD